MDNDRGLCTPETKVSGELPKGCSARGVYLELRFTGYVHHGIPDLF
jgi:hypothetical protein